MSRMRIKSIDVRGFRAFGSSPQPLTFASDVAVVCGSNSQGKTSLAEAFEFLFTGSIVRRELLSSAKDEFAGTLKNVHLQDADEVFVEVEIEQGSTTHKVRRTLLSDYAKKSDCATKLELDGQVTDETAFAGIGVKLSQPPLAAPVLMQHTLPYVFSVGPKERATYFKALLDVDDLDRFLDQVESHGVDLGEPAEPVLQKLRACFARQAMQAALTPLLREKNRSLDVDSALKSAAAGLLRGAEVDVPEDAEERFAAVEKALRSRQTETFPLDDFGFGDLAPWELKNAGLGAAAKKLEEQREKVESEVERLIPLFQAALRVDAIDKATETQLCPLCEKGTLSVERVAVIREKLKETNEFRSAETAARAAITALSSSVKEACDGVDRVLPAFAKAASKQRKERGFEVARARRLAGSDGDEAVTQWLRATRSLLRARRALRSQVDSVTRALSELSSNLSSLSVTKCEQLREPVERAVGLRTEFDKAAAAYKHAEDKLLEVLPSAVAKESKTEGWKDLLDLRAKSADLTTALIECEARTRVQHELQRAVKVLKEGMGKVLDEKIGAISGDVKRWWDLLRPGEHTFFSAVKRRRKARTIDLKASISAHADRSNAETRDAVAVLSYSQLQCLGLALFLARAEREGAGFIVLDDPVLAGDDDHRPAFVNHVVPELLKVGMQVLVMTQDQLIRSNMLDIHAHRNIECFHLNHEPGTGTMVDKTSDDLEAMLARARPFVGNAHVEMRKNASRLLRDAAERWCKEMLVRDRRAKGDTAAAIADYVDKKGTLGHLVPLVRPLLTSPDEPGKLEYIRKALNPGGHDSPVCPSGQETKTVFDHLNTLKNTYK